MLPSEFVVKIYLSLPPVPIELPVAVLHLRETHGLISNSMKIDLLATTVEPKEVTKVFPTQTTPAAET